MISNDNGFVALCNLEARTPIQEAGTKARPITNKHNQIDNRNPIHQLNRIIALEPRRVPVAS